MSQVAASLPVGIPWPAELASLSQRTTAVDSGTSTRTQNTEQFLLSARLEKGKEIQFGSDQPHVIAGRLCSLTKFMFIH